MALLPTDIADLALATITHYYKGDVINLAQTLNRYSFYDFLKGKKTVPGISQTWQVVTSDDNSAGSGSYYETITTNQTDAVKQVTAPWRVWRHKMSYDIMELHVNAASAEQVFDHLKVKHDRSWLATGTYGEKQLWDRPVNSSDTENMFGIPYWITMAGATSTLALSTTELTGFSGGIGGLTNANCANWGNLNATFTNMTYDDGVTLLREAVVKTAFDAPMNVDYIKTGGRPSHKIFTGYSNVKALEDVARSQNQNIGNDVAFYDGKAKFRGLDVTWTPTLDNSAYNSALYLLDMDNIHYTCVQGDYFRQEGPTNTPTQPNVYTTSWWNQGNFRARNRRTSAVIATATFGVSAARIVA